MHKFAIDQDVYFVPDHHTDRSARGIYKIVRTLPESGGVFQYQIKAKINGQERVARENQLNRIAS